MVSNAGHGLRTSVINAAPENIDELYELLYRAYMLGAGAAARHMIRDGIRGNIVFTTSSRGTRAYPDDFIYCGIKAGIEHSMRCIALDLSRYGIRVNCMAPGTTQSGKPSPRRAEKVRARGSAPRPFVTESIPLHRTGTAQDDGETVAFLVSDRASYITGETIRVDGGLILPGLLEGYDEITWYSEDWWNQQYEQAFGEEQTNEYPWEI